MNLQKYSLPSMSTPTGQMDPQSAQLMYHQAMQQAQVRVSNAWEQITILRREKTLQELSQWLSQLPLEWNKSLMTAPLLT